MKQNIPVNIDVAEKLPRDVAIQYLQSVKGVWGGIIFTESGVNASEMGGFSSGPMAHRPYDTLSTYVISSEPNWDFLLRFYNNEDKYLLCWAKIDNLSHAKKIATALEAIGVTQLK